MYSDAVDVVIVRSKESLSVRFPFVNHPDRSYVPNQFFSIMTVNEIISNVVASVTINIIQHKI
jgi:hypothetical protein